LNTTDERERWKIVRLPSQFNEVVTAVAALADTAITGIAAGKSWDPATGGWP
jgi:hypothetical protein